MSNQLDRTHLDGAIVVSHHAAASLRSAMEQMDLLLGCKQAEAGLAHLLAMLLHLQSFRRTLV